MSSKEQEAILMLKQNLVSVYSNKRGLSEPFEQEKFEFIFTVEQEITLELWKLQKAGNLSLYTTSLRFISPQRKITVKVFNGLSEGKA